MISLINFLLFVWVICLLFILPKLINKVIRKECVDSDWIYSSNTDWHTFRIYDVIYVTRARSHILELLLSVYPLFEILGSPKYTRWSLHILFELVRYLYRYLQYFIYLIQVTNKIFGIFNNPTYFKVVVVSVYTYVFLIEIAMKHK